MFDLFNKAGFLMLSGPISLIAITICLILVVLVSLTARKPATRAHHLRLLRQLTQYASALRGRK